MIRKLSFSQHPFGLLPTLSNSSNRIGGLGLGLALTNKDQGREELELTLVYGPGNGHDKHDVYRQTGPKTE